MRDPNVTQKNKRKEAASGVSLVTLLVGLLLISGGPAHAAESTIAPEKRKYYRSKTTFDEQEINADKRTILLTVGEEKIVDIDFPIKDKDKQIAEGNKTIAIAQLIKIGEKRQLVFKPLKAGNETVTIRDDEGNLRLIFTVRVTSGALEREASEVRELLKDVDGITIKVVGQKIIIDGEVLVPAEYTRVFMIVSDPKSPYAPDSVNLVQISPVALQIMAKRIEEEIKGFAPNVTARAVNGMIFLQGSAENFDSARRAAEVAKLYLPEVSPDTPMKKDSNPLKLLPPRSMIQNFIVVNQSPPKRTEKLVRVTVHFVELSKNYSKFFGFKWQPGFTADPQITFGAQANGAPGASSGSVTGTISSLIPKLDSAQVAGFARILRTGTVVVRSGQPANMNATEDFAFAVQGQNGQSAAAKESVGLVMAVTPSILGQSEDIQMELELKQSAISGRSPSGTPLTARHEVKTKLYVKSGESAAVVGVTASDVGTDFNVDDPSRGSFEGTTSKLFDLKRTKGYRKKKSQFVVFVTPQIIENASEGTDDLKRNFRVRTK